MRQQHLLFLAYDAYGRIQSFPLFSARSAARTWRLRDLCTGLCAEDHPASARAGQQAAGTCGKGGAALFCMPAFAGGEAISHHHLDLFRVVLGMSSMLHCSDLSSCSGLEQSGFCTGLSCQLDVSLGVCLVLERCISTRLRPAPQPHIYP